MDEEFQKGYIVENIRIILVNGKRAGYFSRKIQSDAVYIDNIQITENLHSKGIGTSILRSFLLEHQDKIIRLATFEDNPAKNLYGRLGFKVIK